MLEVPEWVDGRVTAGHESSRAKDNLQIPEEHPAGEMILGALGQNPLFISAALPERVFPPLFNRYEGGQSFGTHVGNAIRQMTGTAHRIRTDVSATVFLTRPDEYDGAELGEPYRRRHIRYSHHQTPGGPHDSLSLDNPASRQACYARRTRRILFWIQSMVRDDGKRTILFDLEQPFRG